MPFSFVIEVFMIMKPAGSRRHSLPAGDRASALLAACFLQVVHVAVCLKSADFSVTAENLRAFLILMIFGDYLYELLYRHFAIDIKFSKLHIFFKVILMEIVVESTLLIRF